MRGKSLTSSSSGTPSTVRKCEPRCSCPAAGLDVTHDREGESASGGERSDHRHEGQDAKRQLTTARSQEPYQRQEEIEELKVILSPITDALKVPEFNAAGIQVRVDIEQSSGQVQRVADDDWPALTPASAKTGWIRQIDRITQPARVWFLRCRGTCKPRKQVPRQKPPDRRIVVPGSQVIQPARAGTERVVVELLAYDRRLTTSFRVDSS